MRHRPSRTILALIWVLGTSAWAQDAEIVVTGSRISGDDYSAMPAVVLERRADFLVQAIRLVNDTRAADARSRELYQTIKDMVADAAKRPGIALGYGEEFLIPITAKEYEVPLSPGGNRPDTSATEIYVKLALRENDNVPEAIASLRSFIKKARMTGRTEITSYDDVGLSLVSPEKYRYEIIDRITEDARKLKAAVGAQCKVHLEGLSNRVSWQRSDVSVLTLYIPYDIALTECQ